MGLWVNIVMKWIILHSRNFLFEDDPFKKSSQSRAFIKQEVLLLMKIFHTKLQINYKNKSFVDLCYTINLNLSNNGKNSVFDKSISIFSY